MADLTGSTGRRSPEQVSHVVSYLPRRIVLVSECNLFHVRGHKTKPEDAPGKFQPGRTLKVQHVEQWVLQESFLQSNQLNALLCINGLLQQLVVLKDYHHLGSPTIREVAKRTLDSRW
jgi:hypothetical protein